MKAPLIAATIIALATAMSGPAAAQSRDNSTGTGAVRTPGVEVTDAWARATPGRTPTGAAYLTVANGGKEADRLVALSAGVADRVEIHTSVDHGGIMRMRPVTDGVEVPAGGSVIFKPGGHHVMLMGLRAPLKEGDSFPLTLRFAKAGEITVTVGVKKVGAMGPGGHPRH